MLGSTASKRKLTLNPIHALHHRRRQPVCSGKFHEYGPSEQERNETYVAIELMYECGLRIGDCHKFNESEIVEKENKARFIAEKNSELCEVPLLTDDLIAKLKALPGRISEGGFKWKYSKDHAKFPELQRLPP